MTTPNPEAPEGGMAQNEPEKTRVKVCPATGNNCRSNCAENKCWLKTQRAYGSHR